MTHQPDTDLLAELGPLRAVIAEKLATVPVQLGPGGADRLADELTVALALHIGREVLPADAYVTQRRWRIELYDPAAEEWVPSGSLSDLATARARLAHARSRSPKWKDDDTHVQRRIVRETTTYAVEAEHTPEQP